MNFVIRTLLVPVALAALAAPALAEGDPAAGERLFARCTACHTTVAGEHRPTGPSLAGVFGREAGAAEGFRYSPALQGSGVVWDEESLDKYLENPRGFIRGNRMAFPGLRDAQQRADMIAYLKTLE